MRSFKCLYDFLYQFIRTHKFDAIFLDCFHYASLTLKWLAAGQWSILALTKGLPGTRVVIADASGASREQRCFYRFKMAGRNVKTKFIHTCIFIGWPCI